jgi:hypothetical protein
MKVDASGIVYAWLSGALVRPATILYYYIFVSSRAATIV